MNIKKLLYIITIFFTFYFIPKMVFSAFDTPEVYIVTVNSMDLCEDAACSNYARIGNVSKNFDIASVSAAADVGTYVDEFFLEIGKVYTHARWNLNRAMTVKGGASVGGGVTCSTAANGTAGTETVAAYTAGNQTEANLALFMVDLGKLANSGGPVAADYTSKGVQLVSDDFPSATTFDYIKELASPYTVSEEVPVISMSFNVTNNLGIGYNNSGSASNGVPNNNCYYWVEDPSPIISIQ
tara:strand:+ start:1644 stop:2363 length:720 start_codon:yes stop_codon:yes gene_type:complete